MTKEIAHALGRGMSTTEPDLELFLTGRLRRANEGRAIVAEKRGICCIGQHHHTSKGRSIWDDRLGVRQMI